LRWVAFRRFTSSEGLPQNTVYALAQDRVGFVYAGTEEGLARYDGKSWQRVPFEDSVSARRPWVQKLAAASDGTLWVGTDRAGLFVLRQGRLQAVPLPGPAAAEDIEAITVDGDRGVWVGTSRGLFLCRGEICHELVAARGLEVAALLFSGAGQAEHLYVGTNLDGLYRIDDPYGRARLADWHLGRIDGLPNDAVRALASFGGDLWVGTGRGLARCSEDRIVVYRSAPGLPALGVSALLPTRDAEDRPILIAGFYDDGLAEFQTDGRWRITNELNGLPNTSVYALLETDHERHPPVLWVATNHSGVVRREWGSWSSFDERNGLPHRVVVGVGQTRFLDGWDTIWVGTLAGSVRWTGNGWQSWLPKPYARRVVFDVVRDGERLWVATQRGLLEVDRLGVRAYDADNAGLPGKSVLALALQKGGADAGTLWLGTRHGIARLRAGRLERDALPDTKDGFAYIRVLRETQDADGQSLLWAGGEEGLWYRRDGRWRHFTDPCVADASIMDLREQGSADGPHLLWIATRNGLRRLDLGAGGACTRLDPRVPVPPTVYQVEFDRRGRLYAFGIEGVTRLTTDAHAVGGFRVENFGVADGLPGLEFNRASLVDNRGRVWGGGTEGLAFYDAEQEIPPNPPKPLRLFAARVEPGGRVLRDGDDLSWQENSVHFEVGLLSYQRDQRTRYRAQLIGLDAHADAWSASGQRDYSRLPPGKYRFWAQAVDGDGVLSTPLMLRFQVHAAWWRTGWALALYAVALVAVGLGVGRLRARALAARARELAHQVEQRTQELARANQELELASVTDPLTGLWNRRYFALTIPGVCEHARSRQRSGAPVRYIALLLVDLDHFKRVNDEYGHDRGDTVLVELAQRLRQLMRGGDFVVRWGGEEFLLVLRDTEAADAARFAARVREAIAAEPFLADSERLALTASIGWALYSAGEENAARAEIEHAISMADRALYRAKQAGRNRCCGASEIPDATTET
jgi:diguanylate cyclase (GGDEF)-like protein